MMVGWQMFCIFETGQNVFGISDIGTYFFCEMGFYLSTFELIPSEKTNICCCELKLFRLFPVNPRPSPRCCRLRGNRLWFCAETPCQACQPTTPGHTSLPGYHSRLATTPHQLSRSDLPSHHARLAQPHPPHQANSILGQVKVHTLFTCIFVSHQTYLHCWHVLFQHH